MELKRHFDFRKVFLLLYCTLFVVYLVIGLQPADAVEYNITDHLGIASIQLSSDVTSLSVTKNGLETPDSIVGSYQNNRNKTLLIGHSSTVFTRLHEVEVGDTVYYGDKLYRVVNKIVLAKSDINMKDVLKTESIDTLKIMTCAGDDLGN